MSPGCLKTCIINRLKEVNQNKKRGRSELTNTAATLTIESINKQKKFVPNHATQAGVTLCL